MEGTLRCTDRNPNWTTATDLDRELTAALKANTKRAKHFLRCIECEITVRKRVSEKQRAYLWLLASFAAEKCKVIRVLWEQVETFLANAAAGPDWRPMESVSEDHYAV